MEAIQGGDLYQMQQEAIVRARETAKKASPQEISRNEHKPNIGLSLGADSMVIVAVLALLLLNGCNDMMLILALALILIL